MDVTILKEISHGTPTVQGHQLEDLLRAATVPVVPAVAATLLVMVMLVAEVAAAGAPHTELEGERVEEVIAEAEATQTATSPVSHVAATMPAVELKKYDARSPPRQTTTMDSPPSLLDFAICFSQRNSNLWGSPSMTQSRTQSSGLDATPYPSKTLVATTTQSASTFLLLGPSTTHLARVARQELDRQVGPVSYGPPWAHYLGGYQDRLLGGPLGLPDLCWTVPIGVRRKDYGGVVLG
jgi:hypothetical protein